jgi:hypothetical protein
MDAKEFVGNWKKEKGFALDLYTSGQEETAVSTLITEMRLNDSQTDKMKLIIDALLTDTYYSLLVGLDGSGGIGEVQHTYKIYDEDNNLISDCGEIESEAWEVFHGE